MPCSAFDAAAGVVNPVVRHRKCNRRIMEKFRSSTGNNPLTFRLFPLRPCCMQAGEPLVNIYLLKNTAVYTCVGHAVGNNERKNYCHADARISFFFSSACLRTRGYQSTSCRSAIVTNHASVSRMRASAKWQLGPRARIETFRTKNIYHLLAQCASATSANHTSRALALLGEWFNGGSTKHACRPIW